jgi:molybdopterin molybdotransferase
VLDKLTAARRQPEIQTVPILAALGRVLAAPVLADRDLPPVSRSSRDGFAVRAIDLPGTLRVTGEVRAGESPAGIVGAGEAIEIMTGAPVPPGANAVVMVEHTRREGESMAVDRAVTPGENISRQGCEGRQGDIILAAGTPLGYAQMSALAMVGTSDVPVYRRPAVAILPTGDEVVPVDERPQSYQVRNSNACSLAAQVTRAGGEPRIMSIARDNWEATESLIEEGLKCDLLLLSGGVSAGKYDIVERVLEKLGAEFFFDRVLIQPGQPVVFGRAKGTFFFGLPGNPVSTMVTFELFARAAVELLGGQSDPLLPLLWASLAQDFRHKPGLTRFLPARLSPGGSPVTPVAWKGSSDIAAVARSNAFLVAESDQEKWVAGDWIRVLPH